MWAVPLQVKSMLNSEHSGGGACCQRHSPTKKGQLGKVEGACWQGGVGLNSDAHWLSRSIAPPHALAARRAVWVLGGGCLLSTPLGRDLVGAACGWVSAALPVRCCCALPPGGGHPGCFLPAAGGRSGGSVRWAVLCGLCLCHAVHSRRWCPLLLAFPYEHMQQGNVEGAGACSQRLQDIKEG